METTVMADPRTAATPTYERAQEKVARAYSDAPLWYDIRGFLILTFAYRSTLWTQIRSFLSRMGRRHLEVALGTGSLLNAVLKVRSFLGFAPIELVGFDYSHRMLEGARRRLAGHPGLTLYQADVADLPEASESFDTACIANSFHCFADAGAALRSLHRVLKPKGTLSMNVITYPRGRGLFDRIASAINRWGIRKGILFTPYEPSTVRRLLAEAGFRIQEESQSGNCYFVVAEKE
jgi:ubiquinone/menaquinone biosynthesis C-methylase UbiE